MDWDKRTIEERTVEATDSAVKANGGYGLFLALNEAYAFGLDFHAYQIISAKATISTIVITIMEGK
jgi:hypothetical protein